MSRRKNPISNLHHKLLKMLLSPLTLKIQKTSRFCTPSLLVTAKNRLVYLFFAFLLSKSAFFHLDYYFCTLLVNPHLLRVASLFLIICSTKKQSSTQKFNTWYDFSYRLQVGDHFINRLECIMPSC